MICFVTSIATRIESGGWPISMCTTKAFLNLAARTDRLSPTFRAPVLHLQPSEPTRRDTQSKTTALLARDIPAIRTRYVLMTMIFENHGAGTETHSSGTV